MRKEWRIQWEADDIETRVLLRKSSVKVKVTDPTTLDIVYMFETLWLFSWSESEVRLEHVTDDDFTKSPSMQCSLIAVANTNDVAQISGHYDTNPSQVIRMIK